MAAFLAAWRTTHQTTFSLMPEPQTVRERYVNHILSRNAG